MKPGQWGNTQELLAAVVNELRRSTWYFVKANTKQGHVVPQPKWIRRPDPEGAQNRRKPLDGAALARALGKGRGQVNYTPKVTA